MRSHLPRTNRHQSNGGKDMKQVLDRSGKFYGIAKQIANDNNNLIITMPGDLTGMEEKNLVFSNGSIIYEDNDRVYIEY